MKLVSFIFFFLIMFNQNIQAQTEKGIDIVIEENKKYNLDFKIYKGDEKIIKKVENITQVDYSTPEGVIQSLFSSINEDWLLKNYLETPNNNEHHKTVFEFTKKMDKKRNWINLIDKLTFFEDDTKVSLILYTIHYDGQSFRYPTIKSLIEKNKRWYIYEIPNQFHIKDVLFQMNPERMKDLLLGKPTGNILCDKLIAETRNNENGLDIIKLQKKLDEFNLKNNTEALNYFINQ